MPEVPVIAVTAHVLPEDRQHCLDAGCVEYVPKPFRVDAMLRLLAHYLPRQS
jgi:CheY-like chemotaxis protein